MRQMGGLGKQMPLVRNVFILGALALAGLPILNGFWSKELILESGLEAGPGWAYALMLSGAGLTAFYTFRMVWMVFFDRPHGEQHAHDAQTAMRVAFVPLAAGTLTTWLLAGPLSQLLATSLPYHHLHTETTGQVLVEVLTAPATLLALAVIGLGLAAWWWRDRLAWLSNPFAWFTRAAGDGFWFEVFNQKVVDITQNFAVSISIFQTGQLNWNVFGILAGLLVVLILLAWGAA
jgi:NADH-quinone oxidoreductase subunit L